MEEKKHSEEKKHEKHETVHHVKRKRFSVWKFSCVILFILLLVSVFTYGFRGSGSPGTVSKEKAAKDTLDFLNNEILQGRDTAVLNSIVEQNSLYKVTLTLGGQQGDLYISKDGKLLFPQAIDLTKKTAEMQTSSGTDTEQKIEVSADGDPYTGGDSALVTIVEFSDYQCPYCKNAESTLKQIRETYGDKVRIVYRDFPLTSIHNYAFSASLAANCADEQGKFWEYHNILFENSPTLDDASLKKYAKDIGLDGAKFDTCLDSQTYRNEVEGDMSDAASYGVGSTPTFFVNGVKIEGAVPFEQFKQVIDEQLSATSDVGNTQQIQEQSGQQTPPSLPTGVYVK